MQGRSPRRYLLTSPRIRAVRWGENSRRTSQRLGGNKIWSERKRFAPNSWALYLGTRERRIREIDMTPPGEISEHHETARQQSKAAWEAVASGWYAQREDIWKASRPVTQWMVRKLDPQPGDTVLELGAGLADTGLMAARLVGRSGRVIVTDFSPEMVSGARRRAEELGVQNV